MWLKEAIHLTEPKCISPLLDGFVIGNVAWSPVVILQKISPPWNIGEISSDISELKDELLSIKNENETAEKDTEENTKEEVDVVIDVLKQVLPMLRRYRAH